MFLKVKDARAALEALREEERERKRKEAEEAERLRQIQIREKLEVMRKKKQEYLEYQRQLALQKMQEQEQEMLMRQEQIKQQYLVQQQQQQQQMSFSTPIHQDGTHGVAGAVQPGVSYATAVATGTEYASYQDPVSMSYQQQQQPQSAYSMQEMGAALPQVQAGQQFQLGQQQQQLYQNQVYNDAGELITFE